MNLKMIMAAAVVAVAPFAASAATLQLNVGGTLITDNGIGDTNPNANVITFVGGGVSVQSTSTTDAAGVSSLGLTVLTTTAGAADLDISATSADLGQGEGNPALVVFDFNGSLISGGSDEVTGTAYVDDGNGLFSMATLVGSGSVSGPGDNVTVSAPVVLSDPFSMSIFTTIHANTTASYDATITAQVVPLPAGVLLMGTALAGFGVMRRRKKAA